MSLIYLPGFKQLLLSQGDYLTLQAPRETDFIYLHSGRVLPADNLREYSHLLSLRVDLSLEY